MIQEKSLYRPSAVSGVMVIIWLSKLIFNGHKKWLCQASSWGAVVIWNYDKS